MRRFSEKGNVLLFTIIAMTFMSVLGAGAYYLTSTSAFSTIGANDQNRAAQLARAGINYALMMNLGNTAGRDFTLANGDKFRIVISGDTITSTGIIKQGTLYEAKETVSVTETGFSSQSDISTAKDIQSFTAPAQSQSGFITTDTSAAQVSLGKTTMTKTFGALWYQGNAVPGNCTGGRCDFGTGFRAFFVFQFAAGTADGFTFTFFNGDTETNDVFSVGGHTDRGELMGYAGNSHISYGSGYLDYDKRLAAGCPSALGCLESAKGRGIQPPKVAIEFDQYINKCSCSGSCTNEQFCSTNCTVCDSGSRCDGERDHMAYVFWGDDSSNCVSTVGKNTYDDNKHGAGTDGSSSVPQNSRSPISSGGPDTTSYYDASAVYPGIPHWLYDYSPRPIYAFRVEVTRSTTASGGNYNYTIKSWLKRCSTNDITCPDIAETSDYANTKTDYTAEAPILNKTISLNSTLHQKFSTFFHGWTTATGGETQNILINRHKINFRN